jgi:hypothetical protein
MPGPGPATSFCGGFTGWFMGSRISGFGDIHQGDEVGHVFFIDTGTVAVPDRPERPADPGE